MKSRVLIIIGISIVTAISLSYYAIYDSSTTVFISCDPRYEQIDDKCVLLKPEQYCTDWCDQKELENLGCNQLILDFIFRSSNLLDEDFDGVYIQNFIGLPEGVSKEKFEECADIIHEKRIQLLEEGDLEQLATIFRSCEQQKIAIATNYTMLDGTKYRLTSEGYEYRNATHIIDNNICEWQTIEKYESDTNLRNILDRCLNGNVGFTDEDFARWFNATHFIDTEECLMIKATHSGVSIDRTVYSHPFGASEKSLHSFSR